MPSTATPVATPNPSQPATCVEKVIAATARKPPASTPTVLRAKRGLRAIGETPPGHPEGTGATAFRRRKWVVAGRAADAEGGSLVPGFQNPRTFHINRNKGVLHA